jgi:hypothetical protein
MAWLRRMFGRDTTSRGEDTRSRPAVACPADHDRDLARAERMLARQTARLRVIHALTRLTDGTCSVAAIAGGIADALVQAGDFQATEIVLTCATRGGDDETRARRGAPDDAGPPLERRLTSGGRETGTLWAWVPRGDDRNACAETLDYLLPTIALLVGAASLGVADDAPDDAQGQTSPPAAPGAARAASYAARLSSIGATAGSGSHGNAAR